MESQYGSLSVGKCSPGHTKSVISLSAARTLLHCRASKPSFTLWQVLVLDVRRSQQPRRSCPFSEKSKISKVKRSVPSLFHQFSRQIKKRRISKRPRWTFKHRRKSAEIHWPRCQPESVFRLAQASRNRRCQGAKREETPDRGV